MSRIEATFSALKAQGRKALIPYITCGDPYPELTPELMWAMADAGADVIELADGSGGRLSVHCVLAQEIDPADSLIVFRSTGRVRAEGAGGHGGRSEQSAEKRESKRTHRWSHTVLLKSHVLRLRHGARF